MIGVVLISIIICWFKLIQAGANGAVTIVCCASVLLVELTVFRFMQDIRDERFYFRKDRWSEAFIIMKGR